MVKIKKSFYTILKDPQKNRLMCIWTKIHQKQYQLTFFGFKMTLFYII